MDIKEAFEAEFDKGYEQELPQEFIEKFTVVSCLSSKDDCDTLLVIEKQTQKKCVAKCYRRESGDFSIDNTMQANVPESDAIPKVVGEYKNEEYRLVLREYVEGTPLDEYFLSHHMTEAEIIDLTIRLAKVMEILHSSNPVIVHRDIKPQNVIVKSDGSVALIDFGISRLYKEGEEVDTIFCGTEGYAPPEQYGFMQTDIRSDIYSFGILLAWMLTGKAKPIKNPVSKLEQVSARCTSFSPEKRFKDDDVLIFALQRTTREYQVRARKRRAGIISACVLAIVLLVAGIIGYKAYWRDKVIDFKEPLIEEAVRLQLDKPHGDIKYEELKEVKGLYIYEDKAMKTENEYYEYAFTWDERGSRQGDLSDISDLGYMPNLQYVYIGGERIEDISALKNLDKLIAVELRENNIADMSPLAGKQCLTFFSFCGNRLTSIDTIQSCPALRNVDLRGAGRFDGSPLADLRDPDFVDVACNSDAYLYLGGKSYEEIKLGAPGQKDLSCLNDVESVMNLYIYYSEITDISALTGRDDIQYFNMVDCDVGDLSPLFTMPNLRTLEISYNKRDELEELIAQYGEPAFEIIYTE